MTAEGINYQLVPPNLHHHNSAERAICTFKNHFIAGLCSTSKDFPIHLWGHLLPQAELSLNLLRGSHITPTYWHGHNCMAPLISTTCLEFKMTGRRFLKMNRSSTNWPLELCCICSSIPGPVWQICCVNCPKP